MRASRVRWALALVPLLAALVWGAMRRVSTGPGAAPPFVVQAPPPVNGGEEASAAPEPRGAAAAGSAGGSPAATKGVEGGPGARDPAKLYDEGVPLIAQNRVEDSFSARSIEDLDRGVALVEEAVRSGFPDRAQAVRVLVDGYLAIATDARRRPAAQARLRELYSQLQDLDPREPRWVVDGAELAPTPSEEEVVLRKGVERDPDSYKLRQAYGVLLCERGRTKEGFSQLVEAARAISPGEAKVFGNSLTAYAAECGEDASVVRELVSAKRAEAKGDEGEQ